MAYPKAIEFWRKHEQMHWLAEEVDLNDDKRDWTDKLTQGEKNFLTKIFRFFVTGDIMVAEAYYDKYIKALGKCPEMKIMLGGFGAREGVHVVAYAKLLETVGMPDSEFGEFLQIKQMMDKYDYVSKFTPDDHNQDRKYIEDLALTLAVYSAFTEGLSLFSSFAMLLNFSRFNKMKGMSKIVEWSIKDEDMHCEGMTWVFRTFVEENPEIWTDDFKKRIYQICRDLVKLEDAFIDLCYKECGDMEGLTSKEVKQYIRFMADRRLEALGLKANYHVKTNPLPWMEEMLGYVHSNFFEQRSTEYTKGAVDTDGWASAYD